MLDTPGTIREDCRVGSWMEPWARKDARQYSRHREHSRTRHLILHRRGMDIKIKTLFINASSPIPQVSDFDQMSRSQLPCISKVSVVSEEVDLLIGSSPGANRTSLTVPLCPGNL